MVRRTVVKFYAENGEIAARMCWDLMAFEYFNAGCSREMKAVYPWARNITSPRQTSFSHVLRWGIILLNNDQRRWEMKSVFQF